MATGVLGLGSGQASALNSDLIDKLKTAERASTVTPIETKITTIATEKTTFANIQAKILELTDAIKPFDLFVSGGTTAFGGKSASASGDSVTFDATDTKALATGTTTVNITQLAQKDVYQSNAVNSTTKDAKINQGILTINGKDFDTSNLTYQQLTDKIDAEDGMSATMEQVGTNSYRLVVKSEKLGTENKLEISGSASRKLGFNTTDSYQSSAVDSTTKDAKINQGNLTINGTTFDTTNKSYDELATAINGVSGLSASVEESPTGSYRLIVKSDDVGTDLNISGNASTKLGFNITDSYQSNAVDSTTKDAKINQGNLTINGTTFDTTNKSYDELATAINGVNGLSASVEESPTGSYRLIVKSDDIGTDLNISGNASRKLGFNITDSYQSNAVNSTTKNAKLNQGDLVINGTTFDTTNKSYDELATAINGVNGLSASVEEVSTGSYKLIIKSKDVGTDLDISGQAAATLGFTDSYKSDTVDSTTKDAKINQGTLTINGTDFDTTDLTYDELATAINAEAGLNASVEESPTGSYKLIIKSSDVGTNLDISGDAASALGFDKLENHMDKAANHFEKTTNHIDKTSNHFEKTTNRVLEAKNMIAKVDGIEYNVSANSLTVNGLKISANKEGISSVNIVEDNSKVETQMNNFITKYNELAAMVDSEVYNADSSIQDKSSIKNILNVIKDKMFSSYGDSGNKSVFSYGFQLDKSGALSLDSTKFNSALENDMSGLKDLFIGKAENKGFGTLLKETLDQMNYTGGPVDSYEKAMLKRETTLNQEKTKAEDSLTAKYQQLALQFAAYGTIINQMESSFSGLKLMISQSSSGN